LRNAVLVGEQFCSGKSVEQKDLRGSAKQKAPLLTEGASAYSGRYSRKWNPPELSDRVERITIEYMVMISKTIEIVCQ